MTPLYSSGKLLSLRTMVEGGSNFEGIFLFRDQFYIKFFESAFPDNDFSELQETDDVNEMAGNI